jgi:hypothetical protein
MSFTTSTILETVGGVIEKLDNIGDIGEAVKQIIDNLLKTVATAELLAQKEIIDKDLSIIDKAKRNGILVNNAKRKATNEVNEGKNELKKTLKSLYILIEALGDAFNKAFSQFTGQNGEKGFDEFKNAFTSTIKDEIEKKFPEGLPIQSLVGNLINKNGGKPPTKNVPTPKRRNRTKKKRHSRTRKSRSSIRVK